MQFSPEGGNRSQERPKESQIDKTLSSFYCFELMGQVFDRESLNEFSEALKKQDLERARKLGLEHPLSLGSMLHDTRIKDIFPEIEDDSEWNKKREEADRLQIKLDIMVRTLWTKEEDITEEELENLRKSTEEFYDLLEQKLFPPHARDYYETKMKEIASE